jgi:hypothetical protein
MTPVVSHVSEFSQRTLKNSGPSVPRAVCGPHNDCDVAFIVSEVTLGLKMRAFWDMAVTSLVRT